MRNCLALIFSVLLLAAMPPSPSMAQRAPSTGAASRLDVAALTRAVVGIRTYDSTGQAIASGSGFILPDDRVATNRHVIAGAKLIEVHDSQGALLASFSSLSQISYSVDLAITPKLPLAPATLRLASAPPAVGDRIIVIGSPLGLQSTVSDGIVSALRTAGDLRFLQMTAPVSPGSSGGPVLNERGEVVGITTLQLTQGQNLNFAVLSSDLAPLYLSPGGEFSFPPRRDESAAGDAAQQSATSPGAPTTGNAPLRGFFESIPSNPLSSITDTDFKVDLYGCYGDPKQSVIVCALSFTPLNPGVQRVSLYRAGLFALAGGAVGSSMATDYARTYRIGSDNDWMPISTDRSVVAGIRFVTRYASGTQVTLRIDLGGPFIKRTQEFAPVTIVDVDGSRDKASWLFGR